MKKEYSKHVTKTPSNPSNQGHILYNDSLKQRLQSGDFHDESYDLLKSCDSWPLSWLYASRNSDNIQAGDSHSMDTIEFALQSKDEILSWAVDLLMDSPAAGLMVKEAKNNGWKLALEDLGGLDFHIDASDKIIILGSNGMSETAIGRSPYFSNTVLVSLIRALRDVWQEKRYGAFDQDYAPEAILTLERVRAADLDVTAILVAWQLRGEDLGDLWRYMIGSDLGDLAMRFSGHLEREPSAHFTNKALAETFTQWFRDAQRIDTCDHETLNYLDSVMQETGVNNPFGNKRLTPIALERMSCLPDKTAYLQGKGGEILSNPLYAGLNDEINQSHLMHILYDLRVSYAGGVPFRNASLAKKIFPDSVIPTDDSKMH